MQTSRAVHYRRTCCHAINISLGNFRSLSFQKWQVLFEKYLKKIKFHSITDVETTKILYLVLAAAVALTALTAIAVAIVSAWMLSKNRDDKCNHCRHHRKKYGKKGNYPLSRASSSRKLSIDDSNGYGPVMDNYCWDSAMENGELTLLRPVGKDDLFKGRHVMLCGAAPTLLRKIEQQEMKMIKSNRNIVKTSKKKIPDTEPSTRRRIYSTTGTDSSTGTEMEQTVIEQRRKSASSVQIPRRTLANTTSTVLISQNADSSPGKFAATAGSNLGTGSNTLNRYPKKLDADGTIYSALTRNNTSTFKPSSASIYSTNVPSVML